MPCLRIAYDGRHFSGSQRQLDVRTVEGDIIDALKDADYMNDIDDLEVFRMASRTDKGVSARENLLNIVHKGRKDLTKNNRLKRVNSILRNVWITGISEGQYVPPLYKEYHYFTKMSDFDEDLLDRICATFSGSHNFKHFSKYDPRKETVREIEMDHVNGEGLLTLVFRGRGFLWQMCRRVASATMSCLDGNIELCEIESMLRGVSDTKVQPAPPENLVLYSIRSEIELDDIESGISSMKEHYDNEISNSLVNIAMGRDIISEM